MSTCASVSEHMSTVKWNTYMEGHSTYSPLQWNPEESRRLWFYCYTPECWLDQSVRSGKSSHLARVYQPRAILDHRGLKRLTPAESNLLSVYCLKRLTPAESNLLSVYCLKRLTPAESNLLSVYFVKRLTPAESNLLSVYLAEAEREQSLTWQPNRPQGKVETTWSLRCR